MAEWRLGFKWSEYELERRLAELRKVDNNFPHSGPGSQEDTNWRRYYSESVIAMEPPGKPVPGGAFEKAWAAIERYEFSDPDIVTGHFDPRDPLLDRTMVLELKIFGLSYICGVRVGDTDAIDNETVTERAYRYDTLEGHIEVGSEWFSLTKQHDTGEIRFRISASWRPGEFPNWWTRVGFNALGHRYQLAWHRLAYVRLRKIVGGDHDLTPVPAGAKLIHTGPDITNSKLWVFKAKPAAERVREMSKDEAQVTEIEVKS